MNSFSDIYGYETIKEHMQSAIKMGKVSHAYIINGGLGSGKKTLAGLFAKTLQCEGISESVDPCNKCHSCIQADTHNQPDIIWIKHEKPASIGIDDVREQIISDIQIKPYSSRYKIYIIDEAEKLTVAAQNALLKTIEEPPAYGIIIFLTTNADIFLQTILSRCVMLDLRPIKDDIVDEYLKKNYSDISDYERKFAVNFAQGKIGRARSIVESTEYAQLKNDVMNVIKNAKNMTSGDIMAVAKDVKDMSNYNLTIDDYLDLMAMWFRDVLLFKSTNDTNYLIFSDEISLIKSQAQTMSYEGIQDILNSIDKVKIRLKANVNFELCIELLIMAMKEAM